MKKLKFHRFEGSQKLSSNVIKPMDRDVWVYHPEDGWLPGTVVDTEEDQLQVRQLRTNSCLWYPGNQVLPRNLEPDVEDLVHLPHLHEAAILDSLRHRYAEDHIYTYNGPILIAVNPFKKLDCYDIPTFQKHETERRLNLPHVFGVAERAYRNLVERGRTKPSSPPGNLAPGRQ